MKLRAWLSGSRSSKLIAILLIAVIVASIAVAYAAGTLDRPDSTETPGLFPHAHKVSADIMEVFFVPTFMDVKFTEIEMVIEHDSIASAPQTMASSGNITVGSFVVTITDLSGNGRINHGDRIAISNATGGALGGEYIVTFRWAQDDTIFGTASLTC